MTDPQLTGHAEPTRDPMKAIITLVRATLRDWAPLNELIEGEESKDRDIAIAVFRCIEDFNGTSPMTSYTLENLLAVHLADLVIQGSACNVAQSVWFPQMRNEVQFSDAGVNVSIQGKHRELMQWYQINKNEYEQKKRSAKNALNQAELLVAGAGMSGVPSEFWDFYDYITTLG